VCMHVGMCMCAVDGVCEEVIVKEDAQCFLLNDQTEINAVI
jgi:hypothetical protein